MIPRTFVIGDIHGAHKALVQCLDRCAFNPVRDRLICLGDICDGWGEVDSCCATLQKIPNFIGILGNHDMWAMEWAHSCGVRKESIWTEQGGDATIKSFDNLPSRFPLEWFKEFKYVHAEDNQLFVHGGVDVNQKDIYKQARATCLWDRDLVSYAKSKHNHSPSYKYGGWKDIFVGHTTTQLYSSLKPLHLCNVWMLDTGAGYSGRLTIMDVHTNKFWQSDAVPALYPYMKGR